MKTIATTAVRNERGEEVGRVSYELHDNGSVRARYPDTSSWPVGKYVVDEVELPLGDLPSTHQTAPIVVPTGHETGHDPPRAPS